MPRIDYMTRIEFEVGALAQLGEVLAEVAITRPLLVTDRGIVAAGIAARASAAMGKSPPVATFDTVPPNPSEAAVEEAARLYVEAGCDGVVALGGGSPLDLAKAAALLATHPTPLMTYAAREGGSLRISDRVAPIIAVPTTAGTGSEVGRAALIVMRDGYKLGFISAHLLPRCAICDPELTIGLPPGLTAATGMDAIAHCIETFLSPVVNPPAEAIALDGLRRGYAHIARAVSHGDDAEARWQMMMAGLQGGLCFQKGLGAVHALSHPLGALADPVLHHGTLNAVLLPSVLRFNAPGQSAKYDALRDALGLTGTACPGDAIDALNRRIGMPTGLAAMGVPENVIPAIARAALDDHCTRTNPRQPTVRDYETLLQDAW